MTLEQINQALKPLVSEWETGATVWHRASGKRGVIVGYAVFADHSASLKVDYGESGFCTEMPACLSGTKVGDGTEGDEWKEGAEA